MPTILARAQSKTVQLVKSYCAGPANQCYKAIIAELDLGPPGAAPRRGFVRLLQEAQSFVSGTRDRAERLDSAPSRTASAGREESRCDADACAECSPRGPQMRSQVTRK